MKRIPFINGDEVDVLGRPGHTERKVTAGLDRAGVVAKTKRRYRRRERLIGRAETLGYRH